MTLEELLEHFISTGVIIIHAKKENICDSFLEVEIPEDWLSRRVKDFDIDVYSKKIFIYI